MKRKMEQLGSIDGIPVYTTNHMSDVTLNKTNDVYIIYHKKVYLAGDMVGIYNKQDHSIKWYMGNEEPPAAKDDAPSGDEWKDLIKPIDDMIAEMLRREL